MIINKLIIVSFILLAMIPIAYSGSWSGIVVDNSSSPIANVNVTAILSGAVINSDLTDAAGLFNVTGLNDGSYILTFVANGYTSTDIDAFPAINNSDSSRTDLFWPFDIMLTRDLRGNITGTVADYVGNPIINATVNATQAGITKGSGITDANGRYIITDLRDGAYTIVIKADGFIQEYTNVIVLPGAATEEDFSITIDLSPPIISSIASSASSSSAVITWTTDEPANSTVYYWKNLSNVLSSSSSTLTISHSLVLSSLASNTIYYYNVSSCDATANCDTSPAYDFRTTSVSAALEEEIIWRRGTGCLNILECSNWSKCINGKQTRICIDVGICGFADKTEERECVPPAVPEEKEIIPGKRPEKPPVIPLAVGFTLIGFSMIALIIIRVTYNQIVAEGIARRMVESPQVPRITGRPVITDDVKHVMQKIDEAKAALKHLDIKTAKSIYIGVHTAYMGMKAPEQCSVYVAIENLYEERKQVEWKLKKKGRRKPRKSARKRK